MIVPNHLLVAMILSTIFVDAYITTSVSRSSFVARQRHTIDPTTLVHQQRTTVTTTTTLHMNLFDRFSRVAKSNLNNILQSLEDPEKIMTQALEDMQVRTLNLLLSNMFVILISLTHHFDIFPWFELYCLLTDRFSQNSSILCRSDCNTTSIVETKGTS